MAAEISAQQSTDGRQSGHNLRETDVQSNWPDRPNSLEHQVWQRIVSHVSGTSYKDQDGYGPLQRDTSRRMVARCVNQFSDGDYNRTDGVYVLECCRSPVGAGQALSNGVSYPSLKRYYTLDRPQRVLYVGVSKNVPRRIGEHLNDPGQSGANFTAIYRPMRIVQIGWFQNYEAATQAEVITAELLRKKFPRDFIAQPG